MRPRAAIRPVAPEDLGGIYTYGLRAFGGTAFSECGWNAESAASVLSRGMDFSFLAEIKKDIVGILISDRIAGTGDGGTVIIRWFDADGTVPGAAAALIGALMEKAQRDGIRGISAALASDSALAGVMAADFGFSLTMELSVFEKKIAE